MWPAEVTATLDAHFGDKQGLENQHINGGAPCLSLCLTSGTGQRYDAETETLIPTNGGHFVDAQPIAFHPTQNPIHSADVCHSLGANNNATAAVATLFIQDDNTPKVNEELAGCLRRHAGGEGACVMAPAMQVRRLTPVECERLQGFPDGYTDIKPKGKSTPDGPRYKALGNSWAVPVVRWIGKRIANEIA